MADPLNTELIASALITMSLKLDAKSQLDCYLARLLRAEVEKLRAMQGGEGAPLDSMDSASEEKRRGAIRRIWIIEAVDGSSIAQWYQSESDARAAAPKVTGHGDEWEVCWRVTGFTRETASKSIAERIAEIKAESDAKHEAAMRELEDIRRNRLALRDTEYQSAADQVIVTAHVEVVTAQQAPGVAGVTLSMSPADADKFIPLMGEQPIRVTAGATEHQSVSVPVLQTSEDDERIVGDLLRRAARATECKSVARGEVADVLNRHADMLDHFAAGLAGEAKQEMIGMAIHARGLAIHARDTASAMECRSMFRDQVEAWLRKANDLIADDQRTGAGRAGAHARWATEFEEWLSQTTDCGSVSEGGE